MVPSPSKLVLFSLIDAAVVKSTSTYDYLVPNGSSGALVTWASTTSAGDTTSQAATKLAAGLNNAVAANWPVAATISKPVAVAVDDLVLVFYKMDTSLPLTGSNCLQMKLGGSVLSAGVQSDVIESNITLASAGDKKALILAALAGAAAARVLA